MSKFKVGDSVKVTTSDKTGIVRNVYEASYWNSSDDEYAVEFDDGSGVTTIVERVLVSTTPRPSCDCGLKFARSGGKHSSYCAIYDPEVDAR